MALFTFLQQFVHERTGLVAIVGCLCTYGCLRQFRPLIKKAGFNKPSNFTFNLKSYASKYEEAMRSAADLSAHLELMLWDSVFAVTKGITSYALLYLLTDGAEWPAYTVPVHAAMNLLENLITIITLKDFVSDQSVSPLVYALPTVTTTKWALAAINTGSIPVLMMTKMMHMHAT